MGFMKRPLPLLLAATAASALALALTGCSGSASPDSSSSASSSGDTIAVVASTNVYGEIAKTVGGDHVTVTSLIADESKDPHEFEATASDQLDIKNAQLLIENGGGYDPFMATLKDAAGTDAPLISAVTFSPEWTGDDPSDGVEGFNEHVFYDPQTIAAVADDIAAKLGAIDPTDAAVFTENATALRAGIDAKVTPILTEIAAAHTGTEIFVTEPVPLYLLSEAGLVNKTPEKFTSAVENGADVPAATMVETQALVSAKQVAVLAYNTQTESAQTQELKAAAEAAGVAVVDFSETLPAKTSYLDWMLGNVDDLEQGLNSAAGK